MKGKRKPPHIKQANFENRKRKRAEREENCQFCHEEPCICDKKADRL